MGNILSFLQSYSWVKKTRIGLLMLGLDGVGKTTMLCKLKLGEIVTTSPYIALDKLPCRAFMTGCQRQFEPTHLIPNEHLDISPDHRCRLYRATESFNVDTVKYKNINLTVFDVGGSYRFRPLWKHYYQNIQGLIFVVDTNDKERIDEARGDLIEILKADELQDAVIVIFANKQDLPNAMNTAELTDKLGLHSIRQRTWYIQGTSARDGSGLYEGFDWLLKQIEKNQ